MNDLWYYAEAGKALGPVRLSKLKDWASEARLRPGDMILHAGTTQWMPPSPIKEIFPDGSVWYITEGGKTIGPLTLKRLRDLVQAEKLNPTDLILKWGTTQWVPAIALPYEIIEGENVELGRNRYGWYLISIRRFPTQYLLPNKTWCHYVGKENFFATADKAIETYKKYYDPKDINQITLGRFEL